MTERYALADLDDRRWDDDAPLEGDREDVADAIGLLARVRYAWSSFVSVFRFSAPDARTGFVRREPWAKASNWLGCIEAMTRGLLLMMALALPPANKGPAPLKPLSKPKVEPGSAVERPKYPLTSLAVVTWLAVSEGKASPPAAPSAAVRWRLANRWHRLRGLVCRTDALLRILNDPAPFAKRVARRLEGLNRALNFPEYKPPRPPRLLTRNALLQDVVPGNPYRFILAPLWAHCADLWAARESPG